jgi:hypothetical protein
MKRLPPDVRFTPNSRRREQRTFSDRDHAISETSPD